MWTAFGSRVKNEEGQVVEGEGGVMSKVMRVQAQAGHIVCHDPYNGG